MEKDVARLRTHVGRSKVAIFAIAGFLGLLTYLMISLSNQIATLSVPSSSHATEATDTTPVTDEGLSCGKECSFTSDQDNWELPCASGLVCQKSSSKVTGGGTLGFCRPAQGGSCPLPVGTCGRSCADEDGNVTAICEAGTTCESLGYLSYKVCQPPKAMTCESLSQ